MGFHRSRAAQWAVAGIVVVTAGSLGSGARAEFWDQKACVAEGNSDEICGCTKKLLDDGLAEKFKPELVKAFDENGMSALSGIASMDDQMALARLIIETMTLKAPELCKYKDDPNVN